LTNYPKYIIIIPVDEYDWEGIGREVEPRPIFVEESAESR